MWISKKQHYDQVFCFLQIVLKIEIIWGNISAVYIDFKKPVIQSKGRHRLILNLLKNLSFSNTDVRMSDITQVCLLLLRHEVLTAVSEFRSCGIQCRIYC
jgi:hypothetical protein